MARTGRASGKERKEQSATFDIADKLTKLTIDGKEDKDKSKNILYYGWFFNKDASNAIKEIADAYLLNCLKVKEFRKFLENASGISGVPDPNPTSFYRHPRKKSPDFQYHVTAKYLGREENKEYTTLAEKYIGKSFDVHLIDMFFTPKSCGIRVELTDKQKMLFDERDGGSSQSAETSQTPKAEDDPLGTSNPGPSPHLGRDHPTEKTLVKTTPKKSKSGLHKITDGITLVPLDRCEATPMPTPCNSRAHVTIGCAPKTSPKKAGDDLLILADLERQCPMTFIRDYSVDGGTLRQFEDAFVLYPTHKIVAAAIFNYFI